MVYIPAQSVAHGYVFPEMTTDILLLGSAVPVRYTLDVYICPLVGYEMVGVPGHTRSTVTSLSFMMLGLFRLAAKSATIFLGIER
jgi:hypothetical protein